MKFRSLCYWIASIVLAVYAAASANESPPANADSQAVAAVMSFGSLPDTSRSVMLAAGILAVAFCYHRAWVNFRSRPAP